MACIPGSTDVALSRGATGRRSGRDSTDTAAKSRPQFARVLARLCARPKLDSKETSGVRPCEILYGLRVVEIITPMVPTRYPDDNRAAAPKPDIPGGPGWTLSGTSGHGLRAWLTKPRSHQVRSCVDAMLAPADRCTQIDVGRNTSLRSVLGCSPFARARDAASTAVPSRRGGLIPGHCMHSMPLHAISHTLQPMKPSQDQN